MNSILKAGLLLSMAFTQIIAHATKHPPFDYNYYRQLTLKVRRLGTFKVPMPIGDIPFDYKFEMGDPIYEKPVASDITDSEHSDYFIRSYWDRIWLKDGSTLLINGEPIPLTCIFLQGQDNRYADKVKNPLQPEFILRIFLVANDYTCQGPLRPGWPTTGGTKENWDTYLMYEVRDPTVMLPTEIHLRYRWSEFRGFLVR